MKLTNKYLGRVGLSMAINYFTYNGYTVSLPLNDTQWYDIVVEKGGKFLTVQCKATNTKKGCIDLRSCGGTKGKAYDTILNHSELDYLFAVNRNFECWLIPVKEIIKSGVIKEIRLRKVISKYSKPKLDTTPYQVQLLDEA